MRVRTRDVALDDDVDLERLARDTHGFVGADVAQLCLEAAYETVREHFPAGSDARTQLLCGYADEGASRKVKMEHFTKALDRVNPSALRETAASIPKASWADVGGLEDVKRELTRRCSTPSSTRRSSRPSGCPRRRAFCSTGRPGAARPC